MLTDCVTTGRVPDPPPACDAGSDLCWGWLGLGPRPVERCYWLLCLPPLSSHLYLPPPVSFSLPCFSLSEANLKQLAALEISSSKGSRSSTTSGTKGQGSDVYLLHMHRSHANAFYHSFPTMVAFEVHRILVGECCMCCPPSLLPLSPPPLPPSSFPPSLTLPPSLPSLLPLLSD